MKSLSVRQKIEQIAECIWQSESLRATGRTRLVPWEECGEKDQEGYRFIATNVYYLTNGWL